MGVLSRRFPITHILVTLMNVILIATRLCNAFTLQRSQQHWYESAPYSLYRNVVQQQSPPSEGSCTRLFFSKNNDNNDYNCNSGQDFSRTRIRCQASSQPNGNTGGEKESSSSFMENLQSNIQTSWKLFQECQASGYDIKQTLAIVLAGEYDQDATRAKLDTMIDSAGCVMFIWQRSPSCVSAIKAMKEYILNIQNNNNNNANSSSDDSSYEQFEKCNVKIVRLDDPWDEGSHLRAEITKKVKRSSLPAIFINGKYIGGYDGGISKTEAPGLVALAFQGKLRPMLDEAGVLLSSSSSLQQ